MEGWWSEIDGAILACLAERRTLSAAEISAKLGIPETSVCSILAMLAQEGKVRISSVESTADTCADALV